MLARSGRQRGEEIIFRCPVDGHEDRNPSARWNSRKSTWICDVCKTGGGALDLADRLGVAKPTGNQVMPGRERSRQVVANYDYEDQAGNLLYQVVRYEPKSFTQRRPNPDGRGGWVYNLQGVEPVLYHLPELIATDDMIVVVEGEKDADRLREFGIVATTAPMGAGKWRPSYTKLLAGREVIIIPDNDDAGRGHAHQVASALHGAGCEVRVVALDGLSDKGDVSDWLGQGNTDEDLVQLISEAPLWSPSALSYDSQDDDRDDPPALSPVTHTPSVGDSDGEDHGWDRDDYLVESVEDLLIADIPEVDYVVDGLLAAGNSVLFSAREKSGKGLFFIDTAINVATGQPVLGRPVKPGPVLYVALEENRRLIRDRFRDRIGQDTVPGVYTITGQTLDLADPDQVDRLRRAIWQTQARLVVIDTLREAHDRNENYSEEMTPIARAVRLLAQETGACIVVTHHMSRAGGSRGSTSIPAGFCDTIEYYADDVDDKLCGVLTAKGRDIMKTTLRISFNSRTKGWEVDESGEKLKLRGIQASIMNVLNATDEWLSPSEIARRSNLKGPSVRNELSKMRKIRPEPFLVEGEGRTTRYHRPQTDGSDDASTSGTVEP